MSQSPPGTIPREVQASFFPPEMSDPDPSVERGVNWVGVLIQTAKSHGYLFVPGQVGKACKVWYESHGLECLLRAWETWLANGPLLGEQAAYMNPTSFANKFGYWLQMAAPAR